MNSNSHEMLKLRSEVGQISQVETFVEKIVNRYQVGPEIYGNILISLTEAVTNAIVHGNQSVHEKNVLVEMSKQSNKLTFKVTDEGEGFDFSILPDPTAPENLMKVGGRGVFMMRQLCDLLVFSEDGNCVEMQFKI